MFMLLSHHRVPVHSNYDRNKDTSSAILGLCFCRGSSRKASSASSLAVTYLACQISGGSDRFSEQNAIPSYTIYN